jgi:hypothetical protein
MAGSAAAARRGHQEEAGGTATVATTEVECDTRTHAEERDDLHDPFLPADLADQTQFADIP